MVMNKNEFEQWCQKMQLTPEAIAVVERNRNSEPSRNVSGRKNVTGSYPSKKMGLTIQFESHRVEFAGVYLKEHDHEVLEYYDQPPAIKLSYKSRGDKVVGIYHTPDYFDIKQDEAGWTEWKTEEHLLKLAEESPNRYVRINGEWRCHLEKNMLQSMV